MVEKTRKQIKEEERKAARKAEKQARKDANVAKVEATKAAKVQKSAPKPKPVEDTGPVVRRVKDVWEAIELEKKGITVNQNGEYTIEPTAKGVPAEKGKKKVKRARHPQYRKSRGHAKQGKVCIITKDGDHVRVGRKDAQKLVAEGGKYIAKWQYEGKVNGETVDWSGKK